MEQSNRLDWKDGIWASAHKLNLKWTWVDSTSLGFAHCMSGISVSNEIIISVVAGLKNISMHTSTWKTLVISWKTIAFCLKKSRHAANSFNHLKGF